MDNDRFEKLKLIPPSQIPDDYDLPIYGYEEEYGQASYYCGYCDEFISDYHSDVVKHIRNECKYTPDKKV